VPFYKLYNPNTGEHFYTTSESEMAKLLTNYSYESERVACRVYKAAKSGVVPFYRFWNTQTGKHFFTASEGEKKKLIDYYSSVFKYEGIACYLFNTQTTNTLPFYRLYNRQNDDHFYTINESEKNNLLTNYPSIYAYEGVAGYVYYPN
jgi:hypothetical protein